MSTMPPLLESSASGLTSTDSGNSSPSEGSEEEVKKEESAQLELVKQKTKEIEILLTFNALTKTRCEFPRIKAKTADLPRRLVKIVKT